MNPETSQPLPGQVTPIPAAFSSGDANPSWDGVSPGAGNARNGSTSTYADYKTFVLNINQGEEITLKLMHLLHTGPGAIFAMKACGDISTVTLGHVTNPLALSTYEGRFKIVSFTATFTQPEAFGQERITGRMSISLLARNGKMFGGRVVPGSLVAASSIQILMGSFRLVEENKSNLAGASGPST